MAEDNKPGNGQDTTGVHLYCNGQEMQLIVDIINRSSIPMSQAPLAHILMQKIDIAIRSASAARQRQQSEAAAAVTAEPQEETSAAELPSE